MCCAQSATVPHRLHALVLGVGFVILAAHTFHKYLINACRSGGNLMPEGQCSPGSCVARVLGALSGEVKHSFYCTATFLSASLHAL